jgi:PAS domain S-box-containing protein
MEKNKKNISPEALFELAESEYHKNDFESSLKSLDQLDQLIRLDVDDLIEMKSLNLRGLIYYKQGNFKPAESLLLRSLDISEEIGDPRYIYNRYDNLATLYINTKRYRHSIEYLKKALDIKESIGNEKDQSRGYIQLGSLFLDIDEVSAGREALIKASDLIKKYNQRNLLMYWHSAMGMLYKRENQFAKALAEYSKSIKFSEEFNDPSITARAYSNQGDILMQQNKWKESEKKYLTSLQIAQEHKLSVIELSNSVQLSAIALEMGDTVRSRSLYEYVDSMVGDMDNDSLRKDLAELNAKLNYAEGKFKDAFESQKVYIDFYKKVYDNELSRTILDIQAKYESEKKEKELQKAKLQQLESELKSLKAQRDLLKTEMRFKALIENSSDIIFIIDDHLSPTYASPAAFHALGYDESEPFTGEVARLLHPDDIPFIRTSIEQAQKTPGVPISGQIRLPKKDGTYIWVEGTATNLFHIDGANGIVCNFRDITDRKEAEAAIRDLNESLERKIAERTSELNDANKGLESFSYSVSHDLRAPLRVISGYSGLLMKKQGEIMDAEAMDFTIAIRDSANHMDRLINDLLNLSRLGRQELTKEPVDMAKLISDVMTELTPPDSTPKHQLIIHDIKPSRADVALIKQVWLNLMANAIKYSRNESQPIIEIGCSERGHKVVYYIKDNGAGFDMKFYNKLFGAFQRLHSKTQFEGTGVGLAIVKQIISKHGGEIWAESKVNEGATFFFTLGE